MSAKQETPSELTNEQWRQLFTEWEQSNESQRIFCKRRGISHNSFCYQRSKLIYKKQKSASKKFTRINYEKSGVSSEIKLLLPNNIVLLLPSTIDASSLTEIFSTLGIYHDNAN